jgi:alkanesulfonate monooxygenase SsuD/methylene tetrahydromethanopterin reductase-like flavin-dependent oxidoreductase (luciferase family)
MKLGFFTQPVHPPTRRYADVLREDREAVVLADRLGYREAFIGEHLADAAETIPSSLAFIASLADACPSIMFGTGVLPLPNYHPVMAAAQIAMVDHLVGGRLLLGVGPGVAPDGEAIGEGGIDRAAKLREAIDHLMGLWTRPAPYEIEGEFYRTNTARFLNPDIGVGVVIQPLQKPHPPIVITSIRPGSEGPFLAGSRDQTGITATYVGTEVVRAHIRRYAEGRSSAGLSPDPAGWRVARSIFVADDEETARRYAHDEAGPYGFYFRVMMTKLAAFGGLGVMRDHPEQPDSELTLKRVLERLVIAGTPQTVAARLVALRNDVGPFGTLLYTGHDWADPELSRRSMELMANEVLPRVIEKTRGTEKADA